MVLEPTIGTVVAIILSVLALAYTYNGIKYIFLDEVIIGAVLWALVYIVLTVGPFL